MKMYCDGCSNELLGNMKVAFKNNVCPFCGVSILSGKLLEIKNNILDILTRHDTQKALLTYTKIDIALNEIMAEYIIPTYLMSNSNVVSKSKIASVNKDIVVSTTRTDNIKEDSDTESNLTSDEIDEDRKAWELLTKGDADAFFEPDVDMDSYRSHPPPPHESRAADAVRLAHGRLGGDLPEGFEDHSLLPQKGSSRINRL